MRKISANQDRYNGRREELNQWRAMQTLSDARAELVRLQRRELELVQELLNVRKAVAAQKVVIDQLVESNVVPYIDRLPNELLAQMFIFLLSGDQRRWQKCSCLSWTPNQRQRERDHLYLERSLRRLLLPTNVVEVALGKKSSSPSYHLLPMRIRTAKTRSRIASRQSISYTRICAADDAKDFLSKIAAPKLTSFYFTGQHCLTPRYGISIGDESKFNNVSHLSFTASPYGKTVSENALDMSKRLGCIFHGVCYATIYVDYVSTLFPPSNRWQDNQCLIDYCWKFLESFEIQDFTLSSIESFECLMAWLTWREKSGKPKLRLKLLHKPNANGLVTLDTSHTLYQTLRECCGVSATVGSLLSVDYTVSGSKNEFGNFTSECTGVLWLLGLTPGALGLWLGGVKSHENERADSVLSTKQLYVGAPSDAIIIGQGGTQRRGV
ncbi:hypothetical protein BKA82DRAFT_8036 [Pisolithus tinctorius]|uniref:F-box domain-containing protein n=1 Tax=Pisolithus tinctorius Marx 270 TaxID=870435 RepID=A0A0C3PKE9_PISTI|nr:hypothetical protein BKA82DRAFT_8036 [Pisolithus tinctorius]KIO08709.1 hypothetical protein M404DRAFT_8036 [Pisolithus tinctorius Marx 270]